MRSHLPASPARQICLAAGLLAALAVGSLASCSPGQRLPSAADRADVATERPKPSYRGPARPIHGQERLHRVEPGDSMAEIAGIYGLEKERIETINGLRAPYRLFVGEFLILPDMGTWGQAPDVETVAVHPVEEVQSQPLPELE